MKIDKGKTDVHTHGTQFIYFHLNNSLHTVLLFQDNTIKHLFHWILHNFDLQSDLENQSIS